MGRWSRNIDNPLLMEPERSGGPEGAIYVFPPSVVQRSCLFRFRPPEKQSRRPGQGHPIGQASTGGPAHLFLPPYNVHYLFEGPSNCVLDLPSLSLSPRPSCFPATGLSIKRGCISPKRRALIPA